MKKEFKRKMWTTQDDELIKNNYSRNGKDITQLLAKITNRSPDAIRTRMYVLVRNNSIGLSHNETITKLKTFQSENNLNHNDFAVIAKKYGYSIGVSTLSHILCKNPRDFNHSTKAIILNTIDSFNKANITNVNNITDILKVKKTKITNQIDLFDKSDNIFNGDKTSGLLFTFLKENNLNHVEFIKLAKNYGFNISPSTISRMSNLMGYKTSNLTKKTILAIISTYEKNITKEEIVPNDNEINNVKFNFNNGLVSIEILKELTSSIKNDEDKFRDLEQLNNTNKQEVEKLESLVSELKIKLDLSQQTNIICGNECESLKVINVDLVLENIKLNQIITESNGGFIDKIGKLFRK